MSSLRLVPYNDAMQLGQGYNSFLQVPRLIGAMRYRSVDLEREVIRTRNPAKVSQVVSYSCRFVEKISDVVRSMNISAAASIRSGTIQVSGNSLSVDEVKFAASDMNAVVSVKVVNREAPNFDLVIEGGNSPFVNRNYHHGARSRIVSRTREGIPGTDTVVGADSHGPARISMA